MDYRNAWHRDTAETVTCIACGDEVSRADALEYDKYGDRWDREDKTFEYLCKECYSDHSHAPRSGLEDRLEAAGAGRTDRATFLARYRDLAAGVEEAE